MRSSLTRRLFCALLLLILALSSAYELDYLRALDDFIAYRVSFKPAEDEEKYLQTSEPENWVAMTSADSEQYRCLLPTIQSNSKKRIESYSGPSPSELLQPIYDDGVCSYRIESYWLYELCHGRYVLQYHDDKETKSRTEYYLGNYAKVSADAEGKTFDQLSPPTRKIGEEMLPYYPVTYGQGTVCDLTNKPRETTVLYVCDESAKNQVHSFNEVSSCNYEMVVLTNRLCAHPSFQKPPTKEHEIHCFAVDPEQLHPKPKNMLAVEKENTNQFFQEFSLLRGSNLASSTKNIFGKLMQIDEGDDEFDQLNMILEALKTSTKTSTGGVGGAEGIGAGEQPPSPTPAPEVAPKMTPLASDQMLVEQFWKGQACLSGGSGWWKYEICYGRSVVQFHEEAGKERTSIVLGVFHEKLHNEWAQTHPHKAVKKDNGHIYQVGNLYTQGDLCSETNAHRSCEVRIRCRDPTPGVSPSKVLIYLLEPDTCSYILVVESTLLCDGLQRVNDHGVLDEMPRLQEFEVEHEPRRVSSKEHSSKVQIIKDENLANLASPKQQQFQSLEEGGGEQEQEEEGQVEEEKEETSSSSTTSSLDAQDEENANNIQSIKSHATRLRQEDLIKRVRQTFANYRAKKARARQAAQEEGALPKKTDEKAILEVVQNVIDTLQNKEQKEKKGNGPTLFDQEEVISEIMQKFAKFNAEINKEREKEGEQGEEENTDFVAIMQSFATFNEGEEDQQNQDDGMEKNAEGSPRIDESKEKEKEEEAKEPPTREEWEQREWEGNHPEL